MEKKLEASVEVQLIREARKSGGDRYESGKGFIIYIPQEISRPKGIPLPEITVTFEAN